MLIQKLPQHLINKLKAWEIVERPCSVVKELIENSIDAGATEVVVEISDWWKKLIKIQDNGSGIQVEDLSLSIERYATSKIKNEEDLYNINSYWFRWEALASISEVSKFKIQTKSLDTDIWYELTKIQEEVYTKQIPFPKEKWTIIYVEDLFFNVPARQKFLKSAQTEWSYILDLVLDFAFVNYTKKFVIIKDGKVYMTLNGKNDLFERIFDIYKKDWQKHIKIVENGSLKNEKWMELYGVVSDSTLTFPSQDNMKIFVNKRPVQDKIVKRSLLEAYERQIAPSNYPLAVLFMEISPNLVDVNVHPRKTEVRFLDPNSVFNFVRQSVQKVFETEKISYWNFWFNDQSKRNFNFQNPSTSYFPKTTPTLDLGFKNNVYSQPSPSNLWQTFKDNQVSVNNLNFKILWQIWNSYIILESNNDVYFVDQHAVAERIKFENLKRDLEKSWIESEVILNPMSITYPKNIDISSKLGQLNSLGFDISEFGDNRIVVYAVPKAFIDHQLDIDVLINKLITLNEINLKVIFDEIFATKACKTSIKAWQRLSFPEMEQLIKDWFEYIWGMFVCQHWRPSFVKVDKWEIEKLFDRT